jgi:N-acetyl sugar amidotransferase
MSHAFQSKQPLKDVRQVRFCKRCLMPDSRPRIFFDEDGVCNACRNADEKKTIDWKARKDEFLRLVEPYRSKNGEWDCVVPWSGGKDSSSIAHRLKFELGLNPLLVTFSPMIPNAVGQHNVEEMVRAGFDHIMFRPNQKVHRILAKRFFVERGNPKVAWDAGVNVVPVKEALNNKIRLVFYAEHGESEYGGRVLSEESRRLRDFTEVIEHQIGDDPRNWVMDGVTENDLNPYVYPPVTDLTSVGVKALYFAYYFKWSMYENFQYMKDKIDFKRHPKGRTPGTFTDFDSLDDKMDDLYYYMQFIKFGFGRTVRDTSRFIQNDHMTRDEALDLARKYDGEFPEQNLDEVLEYLDITKDEFIAIVDRHRNDEIWKKENGQWKLRFPVQ